MYQVDAVPATGSNGHPRAEVPVVGARGTGQHPPSGRRVVRHGSQQTTPGPRAGAGLRPVCRGRAGRRMRRLLRARCLSLLPRRSICSPAGTLWARSRGCSGWAIPAGRCWTGPGLSHCSPRWVDGRPSRHHTAALLRQIPSLPNADDDDWHPSARRSWKPTSGSENRAVDVFQAAATSGLD